VQALRAVWRCWETGEKLNYQSEHYKLTLMPPDFSPEPTGLPMVPVTIAAVGQAMLRVAGEVCDGVRLHPLCSRRYLEQVALPRLAEGMKRSGRSRAHFDVFGGGFVITGPDDKTVAKGMQQVRRRVAFYGSTRSYLPILSLHGLDELGLNCAPCRWQAAGTGWPPRSRTRLFAFSPPAAPTTRLRRRSKSGTAA
jgi:probable F420-dependent oxidoreductase